MPEWLYGMYAHKALTAMMSEIAVATMDYFFVNKMDENKNSLWI